ncbi:PREDICTED: caspase-3-like [Calidris pugnax]|uniref:caspase-3-like n=1 Tax=Calidris pugnax TaxID=198806 RepID=UPI00071E5A3E|nr:PREDICTED: caspase-3-like [Calidris pugnax]
MAQPRQSRALIIVNTDFYGSDGELDPRKGAKREAEKLSYTLSRLNYKVKLEHNKTAKEIEELYQQECGHEHGEHFVSIISSHGQQGLLLGSDSEQVELTRIFQILSSNKCPVLTKIPKIFFIQACRGEDLDQGVMVECDSGEPVPDGFSDYLSIPPQTAVMFACSPGYAAFRNIAGSMFLQALLKFLEGEERHLALNSLMTRINGEVAFYFQARGTHQGCKEMPCFVTNLLQEVFPFSAPIAEGAGGV